MTYFQDIRYLRESGYQFHERIGKGSFGKVFKIKYSNQEGQEYDLACKYIFKPNCSENIIKKYLPREIDIMCKISHRFIIGLHSIFQTDYSLFIFMRYCEQGDLLEYLRKNGGCISEALANAWFYQMSSAVEYLHSMNIVHRDVKCENILITRNMNIKLIDFGFARSTKMELEDDKQSNKNLSETYCGSRKHFLL